MKIRKATVVSSKTDCQRVMELTKAQTTFPMSVPGLMESRAALANRLSTMGPLTKEIT